MKKIRPVVMVYIGCFVLFTVVFLGLLRMPSPFSTVLFYHGLFCLAATFIMMLAGIILYRLRTHTAHLESLIAALCIAASVHISVFIVFPVTFDRSVTMFLLTTLAKEKNNACGGLAKDGLQDALIETYITSGDALGKRMKEQRIINMIEESNGCYRLTNRAQDFLRFSESIKDIYNIK